MLDQFVGHRPRVTAYFGVLAVGLSLLAAGVEAARLRAIGPLEPSAFLGYAAAGLLCGLVLAFAAAYLNESLLSGWLLGGVPVAGRVGGTYLQGSNADPVGSALLTAGAALVVGGVGYAAAAEKHRRDAGGGAAPGLTPRLTVTALAGASIAVGVAGILSTGFV